MPECAKANLQQSRISNFPRDDPRTPHFPGRGKEGANGEQEGKELEGGENGQGR